MGNDLREKPDPLIPNHNLYYVTNAGWFRGFDRQNDRPLSAEEAYRNYVDTPKERIKMLLHKISTGTLMYNQVQGYRRRAEHPAKKYLYTIDCLQHIQSMAQTKGSRFYLLVIPDLGKGCECTFRVIDFRPIFDQLDPIYLEGLDDRMYTSSPDCHLNNQGHRYVYEKIYHTLKNSRE
jgi:hypothetical protein